MTLVFVKRVRSLVWMAALAAFMAVGLTSACDSDARQPITIADSTEYVNPVIKPVAADPSVVRGDDGRFYLFATSDDWGDGAGTRILPFFVSDDLISWEYAGDVFDRRPSWKSSGGLWAPDVAFVGDEYRLYYAYSTWGDPNPCIGLAVANAPAGPWADTGEAVFCSDDIGVENSIDPFFWDDGSGGRLIWGSHFGIYVVPLSADGADVAGTKQRIADDRFEAPYVVHRNGRYYLFVSAGTCCDGASSTYRVYVGRSDAVTGPYVDAHGRDLNDGGGMLLLTGNAVWAGPGHNSIVVDDAGTDWFVYHAIPMDNPFLAGGANRRPAMIDRLRWTAEGWPVLGEGVPDTLSHTAPVVR